MKSITFNQLKTMLKSMSNAIFKRMGILENAIKPPSKPPNHLYGTDENGTAGWKEKGYYTRPETIYIDRNADLTLTIVELKAYKDPELTTLLTYDEGKKILLNNGILESQRNYGTAYFKVLTFGDNETQKSIFVHIQKDQMADAEIINCELIFADE